MVAPNQVEKDYARRIWQYNFLCSHFWVNNIFEAVNQYIYIEHVENYDNILAQCLRYLCTVS